MKLAGCPNRDDLSAYLLGKLSEPDSRQVAAHSDTCARCQKLLQGLDALADPLVQQIRSPRGRVAVGADLKSLLKRAEAVGVDGSVNTEPPEQTLAGATGKVDIRKILAPAQAADEIGRLGPYRVLKLLGQGGMGMVFHAEDTKLQRAVALKVMLPSVAANPLARERFLREARATAAIEHDHIVTIYHVEEDRGIVYLAMPLLKGASLEDFLKKLKQTNKRLTMGQILKLGREIAKGLAAAHERGHIHRDIKPANIWLDATAGGRVKILDFGLARQTAADSQITQSGMIVGTPAYMAPEQAQSKPIDGRADLWSLGCVLYRLCTRQLPFKGADAVSTLIQSATEIPPTPRELNSHVPEALSELVMELLAKEALDRPASAKAVVEAIAGIERHLETTKVAPAAPLQQGITTEWQMGKDGSLLTLPGRVKQRPRRLAWVLTGLAVAGAILLSATVLYLQTDQGTVEIRVDDQVKALVDGKRVQFIDKKTGKPVAELNLTAGKQTFSLGSGDYVLKLEGDFELSKNPITIKRGDTEIVSIKAKGQGGAVAALPKEKPPVVDKPLPQSDATASTVRAEVTASLPVLKGHLGAVYGLALAPDGKVLVSTGKDRTVKLWDLAAGKELDSFADHTDLIRCVAVAPNGRLVASGSDDNTVELVDIPARQHSPLKGHDRWIAALAYSPDGNILASASEDGSVRLWDVGKRPTQQRSVLKGHSGPVRAVLFTRDGEFVLSAGGEWSKPGEIIAWEADTGRERRRFAPCAGAPLALALSPDGKTVACASRFPLAKVQFFDVASGKEVRSFQTEQPAWSLAYSADGKMLALGLNRAEESIEIWDPASGQRLLTLPAQGGPTRCVCFAADQTLFTAGTDGTIARRIVCLVDGKTSGGAGDVWVKAASLLPPEKQVEAVTEKLKELNPGFDSKIERAFENGKVTHLSFQSDVVTDLAPIRALKDLHSLTCSGTSAGNSKLTDLGPLRGMPLTALDCSQTKVADLTPLKNMKLVRLHIGSTAVTDLSALKGVPLQTLICDRNQIVDLAPLTGMPLESVDCANCKSLKDLGPLKGMAITQLNVAGTGVLDLAALKGMPLTTLILDRCSVDLKPLQGMPLTRLKLLGTDKQPRDLTPLKGLNLQFIAIVPRHVEKGMEVLRAMKSLELIGIADSKTDEMTPADFWKRYDAGEFNK